MEPVLWSEVCPSIGMHIRRVDDRVCLLTKIASKRYGAHEPFVSFITHCGDEVLEKRVSGVSFFPAFTEGALTCLKCAGTSNK